MPKDDKRESFKALKIDSYSDKNDIRKAYKKLALQCHPDKAITKNVTINIVPPQNLNEGTSKKQFEELSKDFESLVIEGANDGFKDCDKIFFDFIGEILFGSGGKSDFFTFFCGSKQHCCSSADGDPDFRVYQEDGDEEDIDGESELDILMEIIKNRKKKGKLVPEDFHETKILELKNKLSQHKEEMKKDSTKKQQTAKKGKTSVPVAKPKPKSKKQLLAEQRRRAKEMEKIAVELEEKRKEDEEKDKQRKQVEMERQKRLEEERIKSQNEERKRREREQKEREKQQRQEQEKEERRRCQQEEEKKRKEEEEKRKKAEKEKSEKERAARKAALQAIKEKEEQAKAASKLQSLKRQPQQQRTDQQQYPREIPPRFQKIKKQQQQIHQQQSTQFQNTVPTIQQQNRVLVKPQPQVGKKKDPTRFASKEYAGLINEVDDSGWPKGQTKGSGWISTKEDWDQDVEKWGAVDREWGGKEGNWKQVIDRSDTESWPAVGNKSSGDCLSSNSNLVNTKNSTTNTSGTLNNTSASLPLDSKSRNMFSNSLNTQQSSSSKTPDWSGNTNTGALSIGSDSWDTACDDSIDRALDAADSKLGVVGSVGPGGVGWGGMSTGGLGGLIGTPLGWDSAATMNSKTDTSSNTKQGWASEASSLSSIDSITWNKTPGKAPETKNPNDMSNKSITNTSTWGGTPADSSSVWVEKSEQLKNMDKSDTHPTWDSKTNSFSDNLPQTSFTKKQTVESSEEKISPKTEISGWDDAGSKTSWGVKAPDITGTACWDNSLGVATRKSAETKESKMNQEGSGWLESSGDWDQSTVSKESEENAESTWDGWTTASSKRNRAPKPAPSTSESNASNAWMSRSMKQLLDMGFKQEDADKALRANHMNIESAIGDLLSMTSSSCDHSQTISSSTANPSCEAMSESSLSQQPPVKQNRKQRRKTQQQQQQQQQQQPQPQQQLQQPQQVQQQQQQQQNTISQQGKLEKQDFEVSVPDAIKSTVDTIIQEKSDTIKSIASESQPNLLNLSPQQNDKTRNIQSLEPPNQQPSSKPLGTPGLSGTNAKRGGSGLMQTPTPGVPTPLRTNITHPLLQQQLMQQYHLQLRMAQGGLLQSPVTPQQFALFQQMARLRIVQQGLAHQVLNQKHNPHNAQAQQQLYQQQQQIALMLAQIQQQLLQQQPAGNRFLSPPFPTPGQIQIPPTTAANFQQQTQKPTAKPVVLDSASEAPISTSEDGIREVSQGKDVGPAPVAVSTVSLEERSNQTSSASQSRLTQWKQPLLPDPDQCANDTQGSHWSGMRSEPTPNISPKVNRISESVSSRWGVDAAPKLSADPPEFKPGVPWRPRKEGEEVSPKSESVSSTVTPSSSVKQSTRTSGYSDTSLTNTARYSFGIGLSPWQSTGPNDSLLPKPSSSSIRPPPGLNSQNAAPAEAKRVDEEHSWVRDLVDTGPPPRFSKNGPHNDFKFGHLGFPLAGASWSTQDGQPLTAPDPKPWAAPGGPSPIATSSTISMATSVGTLSGTVSANTNEISKGPNMGISSWSVKQPIPSAEEKLSHPSVSSESGPLLPSNVAAAGNGSNKGGSAFLSTWLVLRNIPPRADIDSIRTVCQQHGPLLTFQYNMRYGNSLIRYGSKDQAASARSVLNGRVVQGSHLKADFATDGDIASFFEQPVDWSNNTFPLNSTYGNHWSFQNMPGLGAGEVSSALGMQRPALQSDQVVPSEDKHLSSMSSLTPGPSPNMQCGNSAVAQIPSQLWGAPVPGTNMGFNSQVPSLWSFATSDNHEGTAQSGAGDNGLISPSMTTFLPPGLLNGGESV